MSDDAYGMLALLTLAYPPVSNQEADWVRRDPEVERVLRQRLLLDRHPQQGYV